jgi:hypothetical protein
VSHGHGAIVADEEEEEEGAASAEKKKKKKCIRLETLPSSSALG